MSLVPLMYTQTSSLHEFQTNGFVQNLHLVWVPRSIKARNISVKHPLQLKLHDDIHIHNLNQKRHHVSIAHTNT